VTTRREVEREITVRERQSEREREKKIEVVYSRRQHVDVMSRYVSEEKRKIT